MSRYFIYARKSTDSEDRQVLSIDSQVKELADLARSQGGEIVDVLSESRSAKAPGRPVFASMMERLTKDEATGILAWKLDRLARNPVDGGALIWALEQGQLREIGTPHRSFTDCGDDKFWMQLEFGMAKKYVDDLSDNVKRGNRAKLAQGWLPGCAPLGYLNDMAAKTIVPDPDRFHLVRQMFQLILSGEAPAEVLERANRSWGFRTVPRKHRGGGPLRTSRFYEMLENPFYCGVISRAGDTYPGAHEPMISKDEYDRVQRLLGRPNRLESRKNEFAYTGLIRCGQCGASITAEEKVNRYGSHYTYYRCTRHLATPCRQKAIPLAQMEEQILTLLGRIHIPTAFCRWALDQVAHARANEEAARREAVRTLRQTHDACRGQLSALTDLRLRGMLTDEEFVEKREDLVARERELRERRDNAERRAAEWFGLSQKALSFANQAQMRFREGSRTEKRELLSALGSDPTLKDRILTISVHKPLLLMEQHANIPEWSTIRDGFRTFFTEHPTLIRWPKWVDEAVHTLTVTGGRKRAQGG